MNLIMRDFSYRYQNDPISELLYYNKERQKLSDQTVHYNDLKVKQSKVFYKLSKTHSKIEKIQKILNDLEIDIWGTKC